MIRAAILDLDGTVYEGNRLIDGADAAIEDMRNKGLKVIFCTNNSSRPARMTMEKLNRMGISCSEDEVVSSGSCAVKYVAENDLKNIYFCGSEDMCQEFESNGIEMCQPEKCGTLIIGMDSHFDYGKMTKGLRAAISAERIIVCNKDRTFPTEDGINPGCGAMVASILAAAQKEEDLIIGKPETTMIEYISRKFGFKPEEMVIIGDTDDSDGLMAKRFGSPSLIIGKDIESIKDTVGYDWSFL